MIDFKSLLNKEQYLGVSCLSQYTRVVAGAGSGKTRVLTYRIAYLLSELGVPPYSITALTFTNKAAKEIKERVIKVCGNMSLNGLFLGTIHSWCAQFLRRNAKYIDYPQSFTILDDDDQVQIMKSIFYDKHGLPKNDPNIKKCLDWIGGKKMRGIEYEDIKNEKYPNPQIQDYLKYFGEYTEVLFERKSLDFDDLMLKTIDILEDHPEVREGITRYSQHILIDEFQDTNDVQFKLITLLMSPETSLYVVGDPDQTIYTWRGANNGLIMNFEDNLKVVNKNAKVNTIILDQNYRSTSTILDTANKLINFNEDRIKKDLRAVNGSGEAVNIKNARTQKEESLNVVTTIKELHKKGVAYKDVAVLYRANYLTRDLESMLMQYNVPYRIYGGMKFFQRKEIKDLISYFRLIVNPSDDTSFERIVNVPARGIGPGTWEKLVKAADAQGQTVFVYLKENINDVPLSLKQKTSWVNVLEQMRIVENEISLNSRSMFKILDDFISNIGYYEYLDQEEEKDKADERKENIKELISSVDTFLNDNENQSFEDFINNAMLQAAQDDVVEGDFVSLMTVHTAKGLEFDYVFVYGFCDGVFPSSKAILESRKGIEEERRLAYVAFTRAKKRLYVSCNQDYSYVMQVPMTPSRFIKEAGLTIKTDNSRYGGGYSLGHSSYQSKPQTPMYRGFVKKDISAKPIINTANQTNGIVWKVGDRVSHVTYKEGTVVEILDKLVIIKFDNDTIGKKTFLGSHIALKKI